ncbi:MAG: hypothetical protein HXX08_23115 [Chloroflexi bacterium]|uniref:Uncharacterized protein n=1 Tax=Candidatus Chlorohelix allophototropha TaxID=3003348 RepID=A0A8T7M9F5_9CHLR|nr:hypothetical protein [Chloroflexota bacterium]WJW68695.1 hypothetical protein OZ401_004311 [Chloroflexota bacterium L227-S17]
MKNNPLFTDVTYYEGTEIEEIGWDWFTKSGRSIMQFKKGSQSLYSVRPNFTARFKLSEVVANFGTPDYVEAGAVLDVTNTQRNKYWLAFIYLGTGLIVVSNNINTLPVLNDPALLIDDVYFIYPSVEGYEAMYGKGALRFLVPWQGYKDFLFYCRDPYGDGQKDCNWIVSRLATATPTK